ncbi:serine/threonine protein kinase [Frankia sp. Cpl3]|uniref:serine/threonine-protein kinase n=1 Tax=Parafrankia colletiae TaxID=573497 RepID=UPI000A8AC3EB|nr:serine/threonine-protein kinase [Parafrankia colletiae]MCK9900111.1 serine/threonine protein kinase [Frankia sp. Cpl3]
MKPLRAGDPLVVGPYRLAARLGSGGMGVVYLGVDSGGRQGAVKVLRDEFLDDEGFRRRFTREAAAIAAIDSPRVARLLAAEPDGDPPWIATEYVHGPTLLRAVADDGPTSPDALRTLATGLAEALRAIHDADVVHRDLKPSNVILAGDGPKVIDFGIAAGLPGTMTASGVVLGSVGYMAPELISGDVRPGPAADVYCWALTVAYAASGRAPFGDGPLQALVLRTVRGDADIDGVPPDLRPVVTTALRTSPERRPDAAALLHWLASGTAPDGLDLEADPAPGLDVDAGLDADPVGSVRAPAGAGAGRVRSGSARRREPALEFLDVAAATRTATAAPDETDAATPSLSSRRRRSAVVGRRLVPAAGVVAIVAAAAGMGVGGPGDVLGDALGMARSGPAAGPNDLWQDVADGAATAMMPPADRGDRGRSGVEIPPQLPPTPEQLTAPAEQPVTATAPAAPAPRHRPVRLTRNGTGPGLDVDLPRVEIGEILAGWRPALPDVQVGLDDLAVLGGAGGWRASGAGEQTCPLDRTALRAIAARAGQAPPAGRSSHAAGCTAATVAVVEAPTMPLPNLRATVGAGHPLAAFSDLPAVPVLGDLAGARPVTLPDLSRRRGH